MSQLKIDADKFATLLAAVGRLPLQVPNEVTYDSERGYGLKLGGFYKDGTVTVYVNRVLVDGSAEYVIEGQYETLAEVFPGEDLLQEIIQLNATRFRYWSGVKPQDFRDIDSSWLPLLKEAGLVREQVTHVLA